MPSKMKLLSHTIAGTFLLLATRGMAGPAAQSSAPALLPVPTSIERYQTMIEHSPFAVASAAAPVAPVDVAGFAKDLVLTGAVRLSTGEYITIASRDQTQRFSLWSGETYNGISVVSVAWSDAIAKTKVTLKRGNEFGVISFDEALIRSGMAATAPPDGTPPTMLPPGVTLPNANPPPPGMVPNPGTPTTTIPVRRRIIRSAPGSP